MTENKSPIQLHIEHKEVLIFKDTGLMADFAVKKWEETCGEAVRDKDCFTAALSGGRTPVTIYQKLSDKKSLPWDKTHVFMVDERFVPYDSDENNYRMINRTLLRHVSIPPKNVHPILTQEPDAQGSADRYEDDLAAYFRKISGKYPRFDLVLLGIGDDGHTASLFPGGRSLKETRRLCIAASPPDKTKNKRMTITLPVINNAENIIFFVSGKSKSAVIKEIIEDGKSRLPAAMVRPRNGKLFFLLDEGAGSFLSGAKQKQA